MDKFKSKGCGSPYQKSLPCLLASVQNKIINIKKSRYFEEVELNAPIAVA